ncbi:MAG: hypothetical protein HXL14_02455 [Parvimonas sp.]|nr:hypothetical protein [Parvimonas sp.]
MTEDRKNLIIEKFKEYSTIISTIVSNCDSFEYSSEYKGKKLEFIRLLMELDKQIVEPNTTKVEEKEEKTTTKKK